MNLIDIYKEDPLKIYDNKFFARRPKMAWWEKELGKSIYKSLKCNSYIDLGCGIGSFLEGIAPYTNNIKGYEIGYEISKQYTNKDILQYIEYKDITERIQNIHYECAICIEVAEHLLPEKTSIFIENLTDIATQWIVLTAAPEGQTGTGHINCRPKEFWISAIEKKNFTYNIEKTNEIKNKWKLFFSKNFSKNKAPTYLIDNLIIFKNG